MRLDRTGMGIAVCVCLLGVASSVAPLSAAERPYDAAVAKWIDGVNGGLSKFVREMSDKARGAKVTRNGVETDISDFLDDFKREGKRMDEHFSSGDSAESNVLDFTRKAKATDEFIGRHPGFTGAETEWAAMKPAVMSLASAYGIDWNGDPAGWTAARTRDKEASALLKGFEAQAKGLDKALTQAGKAAKVDKTALKALSGQTRSFSGAASTVSKAFAKKQPFGSAASSMFDTLEKVQAAAAPLGLDAQTVPALGNLDAAAEKVRQALSL
jgi:hypothetical protein